MEFLGMGNGEEVTQCPMPQATGRLSLSTHEGIEFSVAFNDFVSVQQYLVLKDTLGER
ncbi:MAG: hypothetical protein ACYTX0_36215 [Nostoc sp.]